jgi:hypothetical protein
MDHTPSAAERMAHAKILKVTWESGYPATRVSMDSPLSRAVIRATQDALGTSIVALPTLGGSLPMHAFEEVLHTPLIVLPIVNHDNNQHSSNENLRMQNLRSRRVDAHAWGVVTRQGAYWKTPACCPLSSHPWGPGVILSVPGVSCGTRAKRLATVKDRAMPRPLKPLEGKAITRPLRGRTG